MQNGLGDQVGGFAMSLANMGLFLAPLMLRWMQRRSVRHAVRTGFLMSACCFTLATVSSPLPWLTVALLILGAYFLVLLDICGGLPFMMSVKPSQRTEMSAVYSSFRDVSGILSPALVWVVLQFTPVAGVFAAAGLALLAAWAVAGQLHPQLGVPPARTAVIGDTVSDMKMGKSAGAGLVIGVTSGVSPAEILAPHCDRVLRSVNQLFE